MSDLIRRLMLQGAGGGGGPAMYYISPTGNDSNDGLSAGAPLKTFVVALPLLAPGSTLVLMDGTYENGTTGFVVADPTVDAGIQNGTAGARITLRAQNERQAKIDMTSYTAGDKVGLLVANLSYWDIRGIYVDNADFDATGSTEKSNISVNTCDNIRMYRCLSTHSNRYGNVHPIEFVSSSYCLVEETEAYWHHRHGLMSYQCQFMTYRRNATGGRGWGEIAGGYGTVSNSVESSDEGMAFYHTSDSIMENCVAFSSFGIQSHGGPLDSDETNYVTGNYGGSRNQFLGCIVVGREGEASIVLPGSNYVKTDGVKIDSREYPASETSTATAGSATTLTLAGSASVTNDFYKDWTIQITNGASIGEERVVTGYVGATKVATVATWPTFTGGAPTYWVSKRQFWPAKDNVLQHCLLYQVGRGFIMESDVGTEVSNCTVIDVLRDDACRWHETNGAGKPMKATLLAAGQPMSSHFVNVLAYLGDDYGFTRNTLAARTNDGTDMLAEFCNSAGMDRTTTGNLCYHNSGETNYTDTSGVYRNCKISTGNLGITPTLVLASAGVSTPVWIPPTSNMAGVGESGANIGAEILYRYQDGVLTSTPLWDPATGAFPTGVSVAGVTDVAAESLETLHTILAVSPTTLPAVYP